MKVNVFDIHATKGMNLSFRGDEPFIKDIALRLTADDPEAARLAKAAQIRADLRLTREGKTVYIEGRASADFSPPCARCLKAVDTHLAPEFFLTLFPDKTEGAAEEVELVEEELDETTYKNDEIDVGLLLNEQILLERPYRTLCSEGCKGLCPTCGKDLNEGPCACPAKPASLAFAALKDVKLDAKAPQPVPEKKPAPKAPVLAKKQAPKKSAAAPAKPARPAPKKSAKAKPAKRKKS